MFLNYKLNVRKETCITANILFYLIYENNILQHGSKFGNNSHSNICPVFQQPAITCLFTNIQFLIVWTKPGLLRFKVRAHNTGYFTNFPNPPPLFFKKKPSINCTNLCF